MLIHLGMTGAWQRGEPEKFGRIGLRFGDEALWFRDMRRFGCVVPCPADQLDTRLREGHGPDGLLDPLDGPTLAERFSTRKAIKVALLDQDRIAGVGNIHAVEALWRIGLNPKRPAKDVTADEWSALAGAIHDQLNEAIAAQDGEDFTYITDGGPNVFAVYRHEGDPCPRCSTVVEHATMGGRATFWCPKCQPA